MDFTTGALLIAGAFNLLLSAIIVSHAPRTRANLTYAVLVLALVLWIGAILVLRLTSWPELQFVALATSYLSGAAIAAAFWYFTAFFALRPIRPQHHLVILGGAVVISLLAFFSPLFIESIHRAPSGELQLGVGPAHFLFMAYFGAVMAAAFLRLAHRYRTSPSAERGQIASVLLGTLLTAIIGSILNIALVALGDARFIGWGPISTMIMVTFLAYAILRHNLMDIRLIGAELFTLALVLVLVIQLVFLPGVLPRLVAALTLAFAIGFGTLLIRSALREVEAKEKLARVNDELRRLDAAKDEFISIASHQLRTPLTAIAGFVGQIQAGSYGAASSTVNEVLGRVLQATKHLAGLVDELLNVSRIETGRLVYRFEAVDLGALARQALAELEPTAAQKGVTLHFEDQSSPDLRVTGDAGKLHEVVMNLVDNAIKYSPAEPVEILLSSISKGGQTLQRLAVADHGIGISAGDLPRLFTKFTRSAEAKRVRPDGMGLGLYLVRKIVEDHRGRVWVESTGPGKGSTFFVELPIIQQLQSRNGGSSALTKPASSFSETGAVLPERDSGWPGLSRVTALTPRDIMPSIMSRR